MGDFREAINDWAQHAHKHAGWIVALGVVTVIAGVLAIAAPFLSGASVSVFLGFALVIGGVARLMGAFHAGSFGAGTLAFIGGALTLVLGMIMVFRPGVGLAAMTLILGVYLLVDGIFGTVLAFHVKPEKGWGSMLFSAGMGVLLGIMLLKEWPVSGLWAIGTLVGVNLLFAGFSIISIGTAARGLTKRLS